MPIGLISISRFRVDRSYLVYLSTSDPLRYDEDDAVHILATFMVNEPQLCFDKCHEALKRYYVDSFKAYRGDIPAITVIFTSVVMTHINCNPIYAHDFNKLDTLSLADKASDWINLHDMEGKSVMEAYNTYKRGNASHLKRVEFDNVMKIEGFTVRKQRQSKIWTRTG